MKIKREITPDNALIRLQNLCARSERCRHELSEKLRSWGISYADSDKILSELERHRFFDDKRFAFAFTRDKIVYSKWGKRKVAIALRAKRIDSSVIDDALNDVDEEDYLQAFQSAMKSKARGIKEGNTYEGRTKLFRFGVARGFEIPLVTSFIKSGKAWDEAE